MRINVQFEDGPLRKDQHMEDLVRQLTDLLAAAQAVLAAASAQPAAPAIDPVRAAVQTVLVNEGWNAPEDESTPDEAATDTPAEV